jgi:ElaB/YqjD/DUF883 family membrane-anchored ribosome-binding protein
LIESDFDRALSSQARSADLGATAQDLGRRARERASMASDALYQRGVHAGKYLTRNVHEYPFQALLVAGLIGYGLGLLIHTRWYSGERENRPEIERGESPTLVKPAYF